MRYNFIVYPREDLNLQARKHWFLRPACLPISPLGLIFTIPYILSFFLENSRFYDIIRYMDTQIQKTISEASNTINSLSKVNQDNSFFGMGSFMTIILGVLVAIVLWFIAVYNSFIKKRNIVDEAWSDIDVQLKRRYDLIPNLVETVKGYAAHEKDTLNAVIEARAKASSINIDAKDATPEQMLAFSKAQTGLSGALSKLFALSEKYPDLKANQNFLELQREITDTEDKIQAARRFYNGTVRNYNTSLQLFPSNIVGKMFNFNSREFFEAIDEERNNVKVKF